MLVRNVDKTNTQKNFRKNKRCKKHGGISQLSERNFSSCFIGVLIQRSHVVSFIAENTREYYIQRDRGEESVGDNYDRFMVYERGRTVRNWDQATGRPIHVLSKRRNSALTGNLQTRSTFLSFSFLRRWNEQRLRYKICTKKIGIEST